jgi:hypothetical protein
MASTKRLLRSITHHSGRRRKNGGLITGGVEGNRIFALSGLLALRPITNKMSLRPLAALIEFAAWGCPLTPLENWLQRQAADVTGMIR